MNYCKYSVIITVDLYRRPIDILNKLKAIVAKQNQYFEIVIAHNNRETFFDHYLIKIYANRNGIILLSKRFYEGMINNSLLRNKGVEACTQEVIILMDVDIFLDINLFTDCVENIKSNKQPFIMLPCIYLTKKGSKEIQKKSTEEMFKKYLTYRRDLFLHIANPSSVLILTKSNYQQIGGFDQEFSGHGYEDFDFMIRLSVHHQLIEYTDELLIDKPYKSPILSEGFRKHLGKISLPYFFEHKVVFHLFHKKDSNEKYYQRRIENAKLFSSKIRSHIKPGYTTEDVPLLFNMYVEFCKREKVALDKYGVLFDTREGHMGRSNTLRRKIRYIFQGY